MSMNSVNDLANDELQMTNDQPTHRHNLVMPTAKCKIPLELRNDYLMGLRRECRSSFDG